MQGYFKNKIEEKEMCKKNLVEMKRKLTKQKAKRNQMSKIYINFFYKE